MIASKQMPTQLLQELGNEFAAGLAARVAVMREAIDDMVREPSADAAQRLRLTAHTLAGTAGAFGAHELVPHAERLESLGKAWQSGVAAVKKNIAEARRVLEALTEAIGPVTERLRR